MESKYVVQIFEVSHCLWDRGNDPAAGDCAILGGSATGVLAGSLVHVGWRLVVLVDLPVDDGGHDARMRAHVLRASSIATALKTTVAATAVMRPRLQPPGRRHRN